VYLSVFVDNLTVSMWSVLQSQHTNLLGVPAAQVPLTHVLSEVPALLFGTLIHKMT